MASHHRLSRPGPLIICLLALILGAVLCFSLFHLLRPQPMQPPAGPLAAELGEPWAQWFLTPHTRQEQEAYLLQTLEDVQHQGAQMVLLTGRAGDGALFRSRGKTLPILDTITANDEFLHRKFDPLAFLVRSAEQRGMSAALLATDDSGRLLTEAQWDSLSPAVKKAAGRLGLPLYALRTEPADPQGLVTAYANKDGALLLRADHQPALLAAASLRTPGSGAVLGSLHELQQDNTDAALYLSFLHDPPPEQSLLSLPVAQTLAITYPEPDASVYTDQVFLMGTSDPAVPLTVNGRTVEREGTRGVWGVLIDTPVGDTTVTAAQGSSVQELTLHRAEPGWKPAEPKSDGTGPARWGQKLRITSPLASVLEVPGDPDSIRMTAYQGAVAEVAQSVPLVLSSKNTFAYQLQSGHFVLARDCELIDAPDAAFTGLTVEALENGDELLRFEGEGTPLYYHRWEDNVLTLSFYSASFTGTLPESSAFVTAFEQGPLNTGFTLTLHFSEEAPLWGYHVDYTDGGTQIYLKRAPQLSSADTGPLTGITVLLDAGHGADDNGAMGCAGPDAPQEKDVNLALALAAQHRLERLGAIVLMSRTDDTFLTLSQRVQLLNSSRPDFFISVHHNSAPLDQDLNGRGGVEAYWFYTEGKPLADHLVTALSSTTGREKRGSFYNYFYVTRSNICPAVLLEAGFMTVPKEYESVSDKAVIWDEAGAIAQAIVQSIPH